jgi:peptide/nickel transport system permease protein
VARAGEGVAPATRGASAPITDVTAPSPEQRASEAASGTYARAWYKLRRDPVTIVAAIVLLAIIAVTLLAPFIAENILHSSPEQMLRAADGRFAILRPPSAEFLLGTDDLGRDALTRLLYAGRVSLSIGFMVAFISIVVGTTAGMLAGYFGHWIDDVVNAIVQFIFNVPFLFVLIFLSVIFRPDILMLALIIGFFGWPGTARQVRGVVMSARHLDYVLAAQVLGATNRRIMVRHLLPNVSNIILVVAGFDVAGAILGESALSFLGFGVQVPQASWGNMLSGAQDMFRRAPWLVYPPGLMIFLTVLCVVLIADGLRDAFDPRVR